MKNPIPMLALLLAGWIAGMSYYTRQSCGDCSNPSSLTPAVSSAQNLGKRLLIADNANSFSATTDDNLTFNASNFAFQPLSAKLQSTFKEVAAYLKGHPDRSISINGLYGEAEKNTSIFPNLGIARAQSVKKLLEEYGCPDNQVSIASSLSPLTNDSLMIGGFNYAFMDTPKTDTGADLEKKLMDKKITLYFETNANTLTLSDEQRAYFADLISYLNKNPKATISVVGHTDNKGSADKNIVLSQDRAAFVKKYLADNNIDANQIVPTGKGSIVPIADNGTLEGRAKNRRVEISLNKQ
ncbi:MAG: OmpA family protein [Saprospiraceae bacterium]|nr:OmpA family protein [Saprospiraceae bacterium]